MVSFDKGYNPLRWDCEKNGCFNVKRRPKIEMFSECFPGKINFGDVDGIVELNGFALMLEWKSSMRGDLKAEQRIMYERITKDKKITVILIVGDAETMVCESYSLFFGGKHTDRVKADLDAIKKRIRSWVIWAQKKNNGQT